MVRILDSQSFEFGSTPNGDTNLIMFTAWGKLVYDNEYRLVLKVEQDLADYYRILIPKYYKPQRQCWAAHLTVVRPGFDVIKDVSQWKSVLNDRQFERVEFIYRPYLESGGGFYWFNAWSKQLEHVRKELGLENVSKYPYIPEGYNKTFHCTVARYNDTLNIGEAPEK